MMTGAEEGSMPYWYAELCVCEGLTLAKRKRACEPPWSVSMKRGTGKRSVMMSCEFGRQAWRCEKAVSMARDYGRIRSPDLVPCSSQAELTARCRVGGTKKLVSEGCFEWLAEDEKPACCCCSLP